MSADFFILHITGNLVAFVGNERFYAHLEASKVKDGVLLVLLLSLDVFILVRRIIRSQEKAVFGDHDLFPGIKISETNRGFWELESGPLVDSSVVSNLPDIIYSCLFLLEGAIIPPEVDLLWCIEFKTD